MRSLISWYERRILTLYYWQKRTRAVVKEMIHMSLGTAASVRTHGGRHDNKNVNLCYIIHLFRAPPLTLWTYLALPTLSAWHLVLICSTLILSTPPPLPTYKCPRARSYEHVTGACGSKQNSNQPLPKKCKTTASRAPCSAISMLRNPNLKPIIIPLMVASSR